MFESPKINIGLPVSPRPMITQTPVTTAQPMAMIKDSRILKKEKFIMSFGKTFTVVVGALIVVSIIILLLGYFFLVFGFDKKIKNLALSYDVKQQQNDKMLKWQETLFVLQAEQPKFDQMVPAQKDLAQVLVQLEDLAKKYNLVFNSIVNKTNNFDSAMSETKEFQSQRYEVTLSGGDYFTLKKYLTEIESSLRIVTPKSLIYSADVNMFVLTFDIYHR
ncbi:MAG: hypothetical protein ACD_58C00228G0002 [uncultured bacterium]|nr:MAG: hypothetical protein ACD_58C00228G0002 [uncultured bacterium]KKQ79471.1 MAG: hypothetical protein UT02_C0035G0003 [Parcubacteria group bacterium GW2011_GWC2_38_7]